MSQAWHVLPRWSALLVTGAVFALTACGNPPYPRGTVDSLFPNGGKPVVGAVQVGARTLNLARVDTRPQAPAAAGTTPPMLLFVHGSPGDWQAWSYFLQAPELASYPVRMAVDRPGFGGSRAGGVMLDLRQQAALLSALIPDGQKAIVVGHSLGGPLVAWMAIDAPNKVCGAVSIAGSLSSQREKPRWYNLLADSALLGWAIPADMARSNEEMMLLSDELAQLAPMWQHLKRPFVLLQGGKDMLVEPATADEVESLAPKAWMRMERLPQENHFVLWEKPHYVIDAIRSLPCA